MRVEWRPIARADLKQIFQYLTERNPYAAEDLADELLLAADSLASFPYRGRPGLVPGTRELLTVWPYLVVYVVDPNNQLVVIQRIWHGAQHRP
jgi:plasmid stabilization system protein ParE